MAAAVTPLERRELVAKTIESEIRRQLRPRFRTLRDLAELDQVRAEVAAIAREVLDQLSAHDLGPITIEIDEPIREGKLAGHCPIRFVGAPWGNDF